MSVASESVTSTLRDLALGQRARIVAIRGRDAAVRRLHDLGLVPGTPVRLIRRAPLGCPLEIVVRGVHLSLRSSEAVRVDVETL